jgi:hypothetical protein
MSQVLDDKQPRKEKAKPKYEPIDFYQKNTYVDCKDSVNAWCVARILERCDDDFTLKINFDGWSHKWDEVSTFFIRDLESFLVGQVLIYKISSFQKIFCWYMNQ